MEIILSIVGLALAVLAIIVPFWWDIRKMRQEAKKEKEEQALIRRERQTQLLKLLQEALQKNLELVNQMSIELKDQVIFYNVDNLLLDATASIKYELINDQKLNQLVDSIRYELIHLHRKVELQLDLWSNSLDARDMQNPNARSAVVGSILKHLDRIRSEISQALAMIEQDLNIAARV